MKVTLTPAGSGLITLQDMEIGDLAYFEQNGKQGLTLRVPDESSGRRFVILCDPYSGPYHLNSWHGSTCDTPVHILKKGDRVEFTV